MTDEKITLVAVVGPTASGKTRLAVDLAKEFNGEIVSGDSMQIYKSMDIGTAKPTIEEMDGIPHHMIGIIDPDENYSVARYVSEAAEIIKDIHKRKKLPIICGGTGLYIDSLINAVPFFEQEDTHPLREALQKEYDADGGESLMRELYIGDREAAEKIHKNNAVKLIRAVEILRSGRTVTGQRELTKAVVSPYNSLYLGIDFSDRSKLYERIEQRVDIMLKEGLEDEARDLFSRPLSSTAAAAIGYKELFAYFDGQITLEKAAEDIKTATRHYAKRQLTWFRRNKSINWISADDGYENILSVAKNRLKMFIGE